MYTPRQTIYSNSNTKKIEVSLYNKRFKPLYAKYTYNNGRIPQALLFLVWFQENADL